MIRISLIDKGIIAFLLVGVFLCTDCLSSDRSPSAQKPDSALGLLIKKKIAPASRLSPKAFRAAAT